MTALGIAIPIIWGCYVIVRDNNKTFTYNFIKVVNEYAPKSTIYVFSRSVAPAFPVVNYTYSNWPSRFNGLWMMPYLINNQENSTTNYQEIRKYLFDSIVNDLSTNAPDLIFVDESNAWLQPSQRSFDFIKYFCNDNRFAAFWKNYRLLTSISGHTVFKRMGSQ